MAAALTEAITLLIICTANLILSAELGTSPNDVVYACKGSAANLQWKPIIDLEREEVKHVLWFFRGGVATYTFDQFFPANNYTGRARQFEQYGVTLSNVTESDAGNYNVEYVTSKKNASFPSQMSQSHSMLLQVSDGPMVKGGRLEVTQDLVPLWNTTSQQWTIRLLCGFFIFQGQPPIQVEWIMPGGEIKNSSGYTGDYFYLSLVAPAVNTGNYTCRLPQKFYREACFETKTRVDRPLVIEATIFLDELRVQQALAKAEIKQLRQETQDNVTRLANDMKTLREEYTSSKEGACGDLAYTVLSDAWRVTTNTNASTAHCDGTLPAGWYRFKLNGADAVIPTSCVQGAPSYHCGTNCPTWLDLQGQSLPGMGQQVQARSCVSYNGNCCQVHYSKPVTVRNCGTFYVYNLQPLVCNHAYCTTSH